MRVFGTFVVQEYVYLYKHVRNVFTLFSDEFRFVLFFFRFAIFRWLFPSAVLACCVCVYMCVCFLFASFSFFYHFTLNLFYYIIIEPKTIDRDMLNSEQFLIYCTNSAEYSAYNLSISNVIC